MKRIAEAMLTSKARPESDDWKSLLFVLPICAAVGILFTFVQSDSNKRIERILENHATALGRITAMDCHNHGMRSYAFEANGDVYSGRGTASDFTGDCMTAIIGAPITIHYERGNPLNNLAREPVIESRWIGAAAMLVATLFPVLVIAIASRRRARGASALMRCASDQP